MPFVDHEATGARYHSTRVNLRWSDFDQFQHVNNAAYLEFSQDARIDFVRDVLTEIDMSIPAFVVRWASVDYQKSVSSSEVAVAVESFIFQVGVKSFKMRQYIRNAQHRLVAVVDTVNVGVDPISGKSREWTEHDLKVIDTFLIPLNEEEAAVDGTRDGGTVVGGRRT